MYIGLVLDEIADELGRGAVEERGHMAAAGVVGVVRAFDDEDLLGQIGRIGLDLILVVVLAELGAGA